MKSAIVCMTHCPFFLLEWIEYHEKMGFDRIYLRLEGEKIEPTLKNLGQYPIVKILEKQYYPMGDQMERQSFLVMNAIEECKKENIDFLLHIDDDELFYLPKTSLSQFLLDHQYDKDFLHFHNVEAVYPFSDSKNERQCFQRTQWFRPCFETSCRGYGNGKSMACIKNSMFIQPHGVHFFTGNGIEIPKEEALILHYESCDYEEWKWKFSRPNPSHFTFYEESRNQLNNFQTCSLQEDPTQCEKKVWEFYQTSTGFTSTKHLMFCPLQPPSGL